MDKDKRIIGFTELKDKYLPHRYPHLMLDRVTDYEEGKYMNAIKCITGNSPDLLGHYPEKRAIMPGANIIQAFSQLAIVFFKVSNGPIADDEMTLITTVNCKFKNPVFPGDTMVMSLKPRRLIDSMGMFLADAKVGDKTVSKGCLTLVKVKASIFPDAPW